MSDSGIEALQRTPVGNSSSLAVPPNIYRLPFAQLSFRPNPGCAEDVWLGPSLSHQLRRTDLAVVAQPRPALCQLASSIAQSPCRLTSCSTFVSGRAAQPHNSEPIRRSRAHRTSLSE